MRNSLLLVLTAFIWGVAFVAQAEGGDSAGPYTFNCIRSLIGGAVLIPVILVMDVVRNKKATSDQQTFVALEEQKDVVRNKKTASGSVQKNERKDLITGGVCCGVVLFAASTMQQLGIYMGTAVGKAGFLTACYIVIVPVLGIFLKRRCGINVWIGVLLTVVGLYLLCMDGPVGFEKSDLFVLACAFLFAIHIMVIDHFSPLVDGAKMSCIQFFVCGLLGTIPMFFSEMKHSSAGIALWAQNLESIEPWVAILYAGIMSCGVAYTLQIIGQKGLNPTLASLLMSLESVFSVLAGWLILGQKLGAREILGCAVIFAAIILAQLPTREKLGSQEYE
jgi:drug/metabolite transporter (DMT)-like permease